jgi:hypothetical protein
MGGNRDLALPGALCGGCAISNAENRVLGISDISGADAGIDSTPFDQLLRCRRDNIRYIKYLFAFVYFDYLIR